MKVHLTGTNLERPAVYNWRASHISHVLTSCSATCRVTSAMYSHHRVSKPDSDYCTMWLTKGKAILSLFLSWDCRSRYVNRSLHTFFIESKEFVFIYRIGLPCICSRHMRLQANSNVWGIMNHRAPLGSFASLMMLMRRKLELEQTLNQWLFPTQLNDRICGRLFRPCFRITLMNLEPDLWI